MLPFKLEVALPFTTFPFASSVNIPEAILGPTPMTVPLSEKLQFPAAPSSEHSSADATFRKQAAAKIIISNLRANLRFMGVLLICIFEARDSIAEPKPGKSHQKQRRGSNAVQGPQRRLHHVSLRAPE